MNEKEFAKAIELLKEFTPLQLSQAKQSLFGLINDLENEKKNLSNEVRRSTYYFEISTKAKKKRIQYIDEILVPTQSSHMQSQANNIFPDLRISSLNRLKRLRKERERLSKITDDHKLKLKQGAKILSVAYAESDKLSKQYNQLNLTDLVKRFLDNRGIAVEGILKDDAARYYELYRKEGL